MSDLKLSDMAAMQRELWGRHKDTWSPMEPSAGRNFILYMIEEIGECVAILKKKGDGAVMEDPAVRAHFTEEMSDVLMYFTDTLLRYAVTPEELSEAYIQKHCKNMGRNYDREYQDKYQDSGNESSALLQKQRLD